MPIALILSILVKIGTAAGDANAVYTGLKNVVDFVQDLKAKGHTEVTPAHMEEIKQIDPQVHAAMVRELSIQEQTQSYLSGQKPC